MTVSTSGGALVSFLWWRQLAAAAIIVLASGCSGSASWTRGDSTAELARRLRVAQAKMQDDKLDGLLLTTEHNVRYFTGYHSAFWLSPTRPWYVVVPATGLPIAVVPTIGEDVFSKARDRGVVAKVITWPSPQPEDDGVSHLVSVLKDVPSNFGRIGAEMGNHMTIRMPILDFNRMTQQLQEKSVAVVDGSNTLLRTRLVKSREEISKVEASCQSQSAAYAEVPSIVKAGMTESEACRQVKRLLLQKGADDVPYVICRSGSGSYASFIEHPTERQLQEGDIFIIDTGSQVDGYFCDFNRNFAIGQPSKAARAAHEKVWQATEAALEILKPGITYKDLYNAMAQRMGLEGKGGVGRMGHSVGLQLTEWPSIHEMTNEVIEEGQVLSIEPSFPLGPGDDRLIVTEESVEVTSTGYRLLSARASRDMPVIPTIEIESDKYLRVEPSCASGPSDASHGNSSNNSAVKTLCNDASLMKAASLSET